MAIHEELLTALKFEESFKNAMRNYYSYGFKTINGAVEERKRLNSILYDCLEWKEERRSDKKKIVFASVDSQSLNQNPFQRCYRFCKYKHLDYFLYTMFVFEFKGNFDIKYLENAIDKMALSGKIDVPYNSECPKMALDFIESLKITDMQKAELKAATVRGTYLKTSQISKYFPGTDVVSTANEKDRNKTPNNRLHDMEKLGIVECMQGVGKRGSKGDKYWKKRGVTIAELVELGESMHGDFRERFVWMLDFFSKYGNLGEIGMFLLDRINSEYHSVIRLKNEYYMHVLNDFNVIDILAIMEKKEWCKIVYRHGIDKQICTELLCFPLEIRTSSITGRQTLMIYEPFRRSCTGLRIEFIDEIYCYQEKYIREVLLYDERIDSDLRNARELLKHVWGVSTSKVQCGNVVNKPDLQHVTMKIAYDETQETYILNRIKREKRKGHFSVDNEQGLIKYEVDVTNADEMRPWVRSFYSRIVSCEGIEFKGGSFASDVDRMLDNTSVTDQKCPVKDMPKEVWGIPKEVSLKKGTRARNHEGIFSELFSVYSYIIVGVIETIGFYEKGITEEDLEECIKDTADYYIEKCGLKTKEILIEETREFILNHEFVYRKGDKYFPVHKGINCLNWYESMIPLTTVEVRWMKNILRDEKIRYFLTEKEVNALHVCIEKSYTSETAFPFDRITTFDSFYSNKKNQLREQKNISLFLKGALHHQLLQIKYKTMKGNVIENEYRPIVLVFSKRTNRFQVYVQSCSGAHISIFNVDRIETIQVLEKTFNRDEVEEAYNQYRLELEKKVVVSFRNEKNMVDRILTEFSPWKKKCTYDIEKQLYQLTIFYHDGDQLELVIRLMGYGNAIYMDKNHEITKEIATRLKKQKEMMKSDDGDIKE